MPSLDQIIGDTVVTLTADGGKALVQLQDGTKFQVSNASTPAGVEGLILCKSTVGEDLWLRCGAIISITDKSGR